MFFHNKKALIYSVPFILLMGCSSTLSEQRKAQLHIVGTVHSLGIGDNKNYTEDAFQSILVKLHPDILLLEFPTEWFDKNGNPNAETRRFLTTPDEKDKVNGRDGQLAWVYCNTHNIPCLPYDINGRNVYFKSKRIWARQDAIDKIKSDYAKTHPDFQKRLRSNDDRYNRCLHGDASIINSDTCDQITRDVWNENFSIELELSKKGIISDHEYLHDFWNFWDKRNETMAQTICRIAHEHPGQTIVAIMGFAHRYALKEAMRSCESVVLHN